MVLRILKNSCFDKTINFLFKIRNYFFRLIESRQQIDSVILRNDSFLAIECVIS